MVRDFDKTNYWKEKRRGSQLIEFEKEKEKAIEDALKVSIEDGRDGMIRRANKMTFQFNQKGIISYGNCSKFNKSISFIPTLCQLETQECFEHRKQLTK